MPAGTGGRYRIRLPGGAILNIYDALYEYSDRIRHILTSHEQGASHAADGYARATGKVGVCMATSGPGATNLVTGIATAYMDSIPLVAITANVGTALLGKDSFQEIDIAGVTMPITKYSMIIKNVKDLAPAIRKAFRIAQTRPSRPCSAGYYQGCHRSDVRIPFSRTGTYRKTEIFYPGAGYHPGTGSD